MENSLGNGMRGNRGSNLSLKNTTENGLVAVLSYVISAAMIAQCRTIWMHLSDYGMVVNRTVFMVIAVSLVLMIIAVNPGKNLISKIFIRSRRQYILAAAVAVYAAVFILLNPVNYLRVIRCAIILALMLVLFEPDRELITVKGILNKYTNLVTILAAVSVFCWLAGSILKLFAATGYVVTDWTETGEDIKRYTFLHIYYETQMLSPHIARNTGIFTEAPMASYTYCLALISELLVTRRRGVKRSAILVIAILTTFSATGYLVIMILTFYAAFLGRDHIRKLPRPVLGVIAVCSIVLIAGAALVIYNKFIWGSGLIRTNDYIVGFHAWVAHPFVGGGFECLEYLQSFMPKWRAINCGYSNSPLQILGQGGIYLAVPYVYAFARGVWNSLYQKDLDLMMYTAVMMVLMILTTIPYQYSTFYCLLILVYGGRLSWQDKGDYEA